MLDWVRSHQHIAPVKLLRSMVQSSSSSIPFRKRFLERFSAGITFFDRKDRAAAIVIDERNVQPGALLQEFQIALHLPARRRRVAYSRERGLSARRACTLFSVARSALSYRSRRLAKKDAPVIGRMKALSAQYSRYGYRRIRIFLGRDGHRMSPGRAYCGVRRACRCRASGHGSGFRLRGRARRRPLGLTRSGPTTSCSTIVPMASSSSA